QLGSPPADAFLARTEGRLELWVSLPQARSLAVVDVVRGSLGATFQVHGRPGPLWLVPAPGPGAGTSL
ncbi:MAG TPA: hypothetical protein VNO81_13250, partial [Candidatus Nitrosotenuis sp.]|nr:hypothetical protein [Candidatus Nitrosotenuis sp.]